MCKTGDEKLHLQQFRSAALTTHFSHLRMELKKLKEVFVMKHVRKKILFLFAKLSSQLPWKASGSYLVKQFSLLKQAATGVSQHAAKTLIS